MAERPLRYACIFPRGKRNEDGVKPQCGRRLAVGESFCDGCWENYRRLIEWLVMDYVQLKAMLPSPVRRDTDVRTSANRVYGHPAEWASDNAAAIADALNGAEDDLRDFLGHAPPPHPGVAETRRVAHAWRYLNNRFSDLCRFPAAEDTAVFFDDMHAKIRSAMGYRRLALRLPVPCPTCDLVGTLTASPGEGTDQITCEHCHRMIERDHFDFFVRTIVESALDDLIDKYDTREAEVFAARVNQ